MKFINLTKAALLRLQEIKKIDNKILGLYISVQKGGCAGMEYKLDLLTKQPENVEIIEEGDIKIFIARDSLLYLLGAEVDFEKTALKTGFVIHNPNQTAACGCGESVTLVPSTLI